MPLREAKMQKGKARKSDFDFKNYVCHKSTLILSGYQEAFLIMTYTVDSFMIS
jgi:hypothetical protein